MVSIICSILLLAFGFLPVLIKLLIGEKLLVLFTAGRILMLILLVFLVFIVRDKPSLTAKLSEKHGRIERDMKHCLISMLLSKSW